MLSRKLRIGGYLLVCLAAAGLLLLLYYRRESAAEHQALTLPQLAVPAKESIEIRHDASQSTAADLPTKTWDNGTSATSDSADAKIDEDFNYLGAGGTEEAQWLKAKGFPTHRQFVTYQELSLQELDALARSGDQVAKAFFGSRLAMQMKSPDGIVILQEAARDGSVFALGRLSNVYASPGSQYSPIYSEAYRRVALMRGDFSLAEMQRFRSFSFEQAVMVDALAVQIMSDLNAARHAMNLPPLGMEPRPGLPDFMARVRQVVTTQTPPQSPSKP